jgi:hypothetical protein
VSFHALLVDFRGGLQDRRRRGGPRFRFAHVLLGGRRFSLQNRDRGGLPARGFFHRRFASQAPPYEQYLIVFQRAGVRLFVGDA